MQVQVETTSGLERKVKVEVPVAEIDSEVSVRLAKAAKTVRIDGFRKGKVPMTVVKQRYGAGIRQEVVSDTIQRTFTEAVKQENLKSAGTPSIEEIDDVPGENFSYTATLEIYPEFELADFSALELETLGADVADADIDEMIETLRKQNADWQVVEREIKDGDTITANYTGSIDGEAFEGGTAENASIAIGAGRLIPGFEDGLVGHKAGQSVDLDLQFPENYHSEEMAGKAVKFAVEINEVKEAVLPEVDDEFIAKFGAEGNSVEEFRAEVKENMERELKAAKRRILKMRVMDGLVEQNSFDVPKSLVNEEIGKVKREMFQQYGGGADMDFSQIPDEPFQDKGERRVRLGLILSAIIEKEEIKVDQQKVQEEIKEIASTYQEPEEVEKYYQSNQQMMQNVQMKILEDQVMEFVVDKAQVSESASTYQELLAKSQEQA